ncbi:hypothetical protein IFM89_009855 [Coptis chinensis]|uniref:FHA domain-containing protein n=1 Tax=Coptis chinensis TaxID=261450 RepID=A0A835I0M8_9MAGN|nr:hypothetical protein IFM89_009855 [Coptis chinensis]
MAEEDQEEKKIPIFTVLKKGLIFKNIILLDKNTSPPLNPDNQPIKSVENHTPDNEDEQVLIIGRHPDCNIMLTHPSISRFHVQIVLQPSLQKLFVIDLSSVHGTWVSDQKIEPQVLVELKEGDVLRLGVSTRSYRLHWVPFSRAFDVENPLISPILETPLTPGENKERESLKNEDLNTFEQKHSSPSAPPMPESMNFAFTDEVLPPLSIHNEEENLSPLVVVSAYRSICITSPSSCGPLAPESVNSSLVPGERVLTETASQQFDKENQENSPNMFSESSPFVEENQESTLRGLEKESSIPSIWSRRGKLASSLRVQTIKSRGKNMEVGTESENHNEMIDGLSTKVLFSCSDGEQESCTPDKENFTPKPGLGSNSMKREKREDTELQKSYGSLSSNGDFTPDKENFTPKPGLGSKLVKKGRRVGIELQKSCGSLSSNGNQEENGMSAFSKKENLTPIVLSDSRLKKPLSGSRLRQEADVILSKRRAGRVPFQPLFVNTMSSSISEASGLKATRSSISVNYDQTVEITAPYTANQSFRERNRMWYMVVDTNCLLNKESRRSLQLLQGLKGTQLIVPRMVIRELDCLKRHDSLFRRTTEVSLVLSWIEKCMVEDKWWIHVQNSMEGSTPIAPTPPASPRSSSWLSEVGNSLCGKSVPFSPWGSLDQIFSPTAEDHILDCALLLKRKKKDDGQFVLLSNDIALKIKAMAEGLLCETAEEFRESLVNPYSKRFLWSKSAPRGATWSSMDEVALRENYCYFPAKNIASKAAEGAKKGLKLILQHNTRYGQMNTV